MCFPGESRDPCQPWIPAFADNARRKGHKIRQGKWLDRELRPNSGSKHLCQETYAASERRGEIFVEEQHSLLSSLEYSSPRVAGEQHFAVGRHRGLAARGVMGEDRH